MILVDLAQLRELTPLGLQLLQAHDVRPLALQPFPELGCTGAYAIDVPGGDFHASSGDCLHS
jgi:hypothetical protein